MIKKCSMAFGVLLAAALTGCSSDDVAQSTTPSQLSDLQEVSTKEVPDQVMSRVATGKVIGNQKEYLEVVKKQSKVYDLGLFNNYNEKEIYPGNVLNGDAFMNDVYASVYINKPQPITISTTLQGANYKVSRSIIPTRSNVRQSINDMLYGNTDMPIPDTKNAPSNLYYQADEVTTSESFNKSFNLHVKFGILGNLVKANFDYSNDKFHSLTERNVLVKIKQKFYSVSVDTQDPNGWGDFTGLKKYAPVYVSNVDYGRVVYMLIKSTENIDSIKKTISAGVELGLKKVSVGASTKYTSALKKMFSNNQVKVVVSGGPVKNISKINGFDDLIKYLQVPNESDLVNSSVPIGYTISRISDQTPVEVGIYYSEEKLVLDK